MKNCFRCSLPLALAAFSVTGCAMFKSETPVQYIKAAVAIGTADQIKSRFQLSRASGSVRTASGITDAAIDQRSQSLAALEATEVTVLGNLTQTLANMQLRADKYSEQRITTFGGATLLSIAATILTVTNPAANAATIAASPPPAPASSACKAPASRRASPARPSSGSAPTS